MGAHVPVAEDGQFVYGSVLWLLDMVFNGSAYAYAVLAIIFTFGQAIYINAVVNRHKLMGRNNFVTAYLYISLSSLHPSFGEFSEVLLANWFIIAGIDLLLTMHQTNNPRQVIYNTGFALSMAAMVHPPAILFMPAMFMTLSLMRRFLLAEWMVAFLGYLTPIYFAAGCLYLFSDLQQFVYWARFGFSLPSGLQDPTLIIGTVTGVLIFLVLGLYTIQGQIVKVGVFVRRGWSVLTILLFSATFVAVFTRISVDNAWLITMVPLSIIIAPAINNEKTKRFSNFVFYFSLALVLFAQLAINF